MKPRRKLSQTLGNKMSIKCCYADRIVKISIPKDEACLDTVVRSVKCKFGIQENDIFGLFFEKEFKEKLDDNEDVINTCKCNGATLKLFVMHKVINCSHKPETENPEISKNIEKIMEKVLSQDLFIRFTKKQLKKDSISQEDFINSLKGNLKDENFQEKLIKILENSLKN